MSQPSDRQRTSDRHVSRYSDIGPAKNSNGNADRQQKIPVSLGKPSLRIRLEAYYSLIAPDQIANKDEWRGRFDQIWEKYGGSHRGESSLAKKLAKKYGNSVRLLLAASVAAPTRSQQVPRESSSSCPSTNVTKRDEGWFALTDKERGSGVVDFRSDKFDPAAALMTTSSSAVAQANPWIQQSPKLDRIEQFRSYLPKEDPLYREAPVRRPKDSSNAAADDSRPKSKPPSCFAAIAETHEKGPYSVLHQAFVNRQRVRVLIRYVNSIRGTLTGYLVAFDKHMNMILRDVDELYTPRHTGESGDLQMSNLEIELQRRKAGLTGNNQTGHTWSVRQRHMRQILVRGDNVVLVYKAAQERSAWPTSSKSPAKSKRRRQANLKTVAPEERVGTPGSLIYAAAQRHRSQRDIKSGRGGGGRYDYASY